MAYTFLYIHFPFHTILLLFHALHISFSTQLCSFSTCLTHFLHTFQLVLHIAFTFHLHITVPPLHVNFPCIIYIHTSFTFLPCHTHCFPNTYDVISSPTTALQTLFYSPYSHICFPNIISVYLASSTHSILHISFSHKLISRDFR